MGIDRIVENIRRRETSPTDDGYKVLVAHMGENSKLAGVTLSADLRRGGVAAVLAPAGRSLKGQLRYASSIRATHAVIIGDRELAKGDFVLRDMAKSEQREVARAELLSILQAP